MLRVVVDTNVLVSAFIFLGIPGQVIDRSGLDYQLVLTPLTLAELTQVLHRPKFTSKFGATVITIESYLSSIRTMATFVRDIEPFPIFRPDPDDAKFLACAETVDAAYLVTGDAALLKLKRYHETKILTPRAFLTVLEHNA